MLQLCIWHMRNERARDTGNRTYLARRCRPVLLAQLYYAGRELLFCCGVLTAFFVFFVAEGWFDFETASLFLAPSFLSSTFSGWWKLQCWLHPLYRTVMLHARHWILRVSFWVSISLRDPVISPTRSGHFDICPGCRPVLKAQLFVQTSLKILPMFCQSLLNHIYQNFTGFSFFSLFFFFFTARRILAKFRQNVCRNLPKI